MSTIKSADTEQPSIADAINEQLRAANCEWIVEQHPHCLRIHDADGDCISIVALSTTWNEIVIAEKFFGIGFRRGERVGNETLASALRSLLGCPSAGSTT